MKKVFTIEACVDYEGCNLVAVAYNSTQLIKKLEEIEGAVGRMGDNLEVRLWDEKGKELEKQIIKITIGGSLLFGPWEKKE
jgi:hypothetical protein